MTGVYGAHFFHRWKGWWGTSAAFRQPYRGHEPFPGPHPSAVAAANATLPAPPVPGRTPMVTPTPIQTIQPAYAQSGTPVAQKARSDDPESQILDRWKDSGKPLR
jgi:hypothetical protein